MHAWDVLATMTPSEYSGDPPVPGVESGFQSWQYREIEFLLGNKNARDAAAACERPRSGRLEQAFDEPSLYDEAIRLLARRGFVLTQRCSAATRPAARLPTRRSRPPGSRYIARRSEHWDLYELAEELVDLEDAFRLWRFSHVTTVERIIGFKPGTGGTSGVAYLRQACSTSCSFRSCGRSGPISDIAPAAAAFDAVMRTASAVLGTVPVRRIDATRISLRPERIFR